MHPQGELLDVQHDVRHVFPNAGNAAELVQHAVDLHRGNGGALQRGQQDAANRIAQRHAEAAFQRLGHDKGGARRIGPGLELQLLRH